MSEKVQAKASSATKVWIVAPTPPPYGGMSVQAVKLAKRLAESGIHAELVSTNPDFPPGLRWVHRIPAVRTIVREVQYLITLCRVLRTRAVIHHFSASHLFFFLHSAPLLLACPLFGSRVVLNYRGGDAANFLRRWSWIAVPLMRRADEIVVPSTFLQRVFDDFGLASTVVPNLADADLFRFVERDHFVPRLLVTRSLEPMYDIECVLRTFRVVQNKYPQAHLGIAGAGSEAERLRGLAREWRLTGVTWHGAVPHEQLPELYRQHDIYVNASCVDNFPGALVEAACAGLPIVTTRAGGIPEMIRHCDNGFLCELGNAEALARSVLEILNRPELGRRIAKNARMWAEQFSWQCIFPKLERCYGFRTESADSAVEASEALAH